MKTSEGASPETGSEKHRDRARRLALSIPAPCVCVETPLCNQHKAIEAKVIAALARVEAETWQRATEVVESYLEPPGGPVDTGKIWRNGMVLFLAERLRARAPEPVAGDAIQNTNGFREARDGAGAHAGGGRDARADADAKGEVKL